MELFDSSDNRVRCPQCGTLRLRVRTRPDRIDRLQGNRLLNKIRARRGDTLYHCIYCRLQFYVARRPGAEDSVDEGGPAAASPDASENTDPEPVAAQPTPFGVAPVPDGSNLGPKVWVLGAIQAGEDLCVDGFVQGVVESDGHRITIGERGKIEATVEACELEIRGSLYGDSRWRFGRRCAPVLPW